MFFVLSSGRSGSKTSSEVFSQFDNCFCGHHCQPEFVVEASEYFYGDYPREKIAQDLRESRRPMVEGRIYGEANLQFSLILPILVDEFPDAKFLWWMRDGRDAVASMYYRGWFDPTNKRVKEIWHRGRLQGDRTGDFTPDAWAALDRFEKCCWLWKKYNLVIQEGLAGLNDDRWRFVQLESLRASLDELAGFLGLAGSSQIAVARHNIAFQKVVRWKDWSAGQRRFFENHCSDVMDRWYPNWRSARGRWRSLNGERPDGETLARDAYELARKAVRRAIKKIRKAVWLEDVHAEQQPPRRKIE